MEELILKIKDKSKIPFLKQLLKRMEFLEVVETPSKKRNSKGKGILSDIDESVEFIKRYNNGEVKAKPFKQLLNEL